MASKAKSHTNNGADTVESALYSGAEAMKDGFEKAIKNYDQFVAFSKDMAEAMIKSANATGKGFDPQQRGFLLHPQVDRGGRCRNEGHYGFEKRR